MTVGWFLSRLKENKKRDMEKQQYREHNQIEEFANPNTLDPLDIKSRYSFIAAETLQELRVFCHWIPGISRIANKRQRRVMEIGVYFTS
jgi:hypothetical protein